MASKKNLYVNTCADAGVPGVASGKLTMKYKSTSAGVSPLLTPSIKLETPSPGTLRLIAQSLFVEGFVNVVSDGPDALRGVCP